MKVVTHFEPVSLPCRGMDAFSDPTTLPPGFFQLVQNYRLDTGVFVVRDGISDLSATGLVSGYTVGLEVLLIEGTPYVYIAIDTGGAIRVYRSTGSAFSEMTAGSGTYGNTRFTTGSTITPTVNTIDAGNDLVQYLADPEWPSGQKVTPTATGSGLTLGVDYYLHKSSSTDYSVHTTYGLAILGTSKINLTGVGSFGNLVPNEGYKRVAFSVVKHPSKPTAGVLSTEANKDIVVCSEGVKTLVGSSLLVPHKNVWLPTTAYQFTCNFGFAVAGSFVTGLTNSRSDADVTVSSAAYTAGGGDSADYIEFGTASDTGDWGAFHFGSFVGNGVGSLNGPQLVVFYGTTFTDPWETLAVDLFDNTASAWVTVYDPTSRSYNKPLVLDCGKAVSMGVFDVDESIVIPTHTLQRFRLRYTPAGSPSVAIRVYVFAVAAGADSVSNTNFGLLYYHSGSYAKSEGKVCRFDGGLDLRRLGIGGPLNSIKVPVDSRVLYKAYLTYQAPPDTFDGYVHDISTGLDTVLAYSQVGTPDNQQRPNRFYLCDSMTIATGSWTQVYADYKRVEWIVNNIVTYQDEMAPAYHRACPPHTCSCTGDGRLVVGNTKNQTGATRGGSVQCSKAGDCFDFSEQLRFNLDGSIDPTSPVAIDIGSERAMNVVSTSSSRSDQQVSSPLVLLTDKNAWVINTKDSRTAVSAAIVAPYGTKSPDSVCFGGGAVYWFDTDREVRRMFQTVDSPSFRKVDTLWRSIPTSTTRTGSNPQSRPRDERVWVRYFRDKLYIGYTASGNTYNTSCSVYDTVENIWYDDLLGVDFEKAVVWPVSGNLYQLRAFSIGDDTSAIASAPTYYRHEQAGVTTDVGAGITARVDLRYIHFADDDEIWTGWMFGQIGVVADKSTGQSLTVTRTAMPSGSTAVGTVDLDDEVTGNQLVRWDTDPATDLKVGVRGVACMVSISGTYTSGKRLMAIYQRIDPRGGEGDVNN